MSTLPRTQPCTGHHYKIVPLALPTSTSPTTPTRNRSEPRGSPCVHLRPAAAPARGQTGWWHCTLPPAPGVCLRPLVVHSGSNTMGSATIRGRESHPASTLALCQCPRVEGLEPVHVHCRVVQHLLWKRKRIADGDPAGSPGLSQSGNSLQMSAASRSWFYGCTSSPTFSSMSTRLAIFHSFCAVTKG
jgi:hypothetical protein